MYAADAMTLSELKAKLADLGETKAAAEKKLKLTEGRAERNRQLEQDREVLINKYRSGLITVAWLNSAPNSATRYTVGLD